MWNSSLYLITFDPDTQDNRSMWLQRIWKSKSQCRLHESKMYYQQKPFFSHLISNLSLRKAHRHHLHDSQPSLISINILHEGTDESIYLIRIWWHFLRNNHLRQNVLGTGFITGIVKTLYPHFMCNITRYDILRAFCKLHADREQWHYRKSPIGK